jgi:hypothetical protein
MAFAQTVADFYRGKSIDLYINGSVGGGYDLYGRMVERHIGKHIPGNPTVLPKNRKAAACGSPIGSTMWARRTAPPSGP